MGGASSKSGRGKVATPSCDLAPPNRISAKSKETKSIIRRFASQFADLIDSTVVPELEPANHACISQFTQDHKLLGTSCCWMVEGMHLTTLITLFYSNVLAVGWQIGMRIHFLIENSAHARTSHPL